MGGRGQSTPGAIKNAMTHNRGNANDIAEKVAKIDEEIAKIDNAMAGATPAEQKKLKAQITKLDKLIKDAEEKQRKFRK